LTVPVISAILHQNNALSGKADVEMMGLKWAWPCHAPTEITPQPIFRSAITQWDRFSGIFVNHPRAAGWIGRMLKTERP
jgi:hypothetical protein